MPLDLSREVRIHLALWRKALQSGRLELKLESYSQVLSMRMAMYRSIRPFREDPYRDPELTEAASKLCIVAPKNSNLLKLTDRKSLLASEAAMEQLGLTEADLFSPEERMLQSRMEDQLDKLVVREEARAVAPDPLEADNPFFTRD